MKQSHFSSSSIAMTAALIGALASTSCAVKINSLSTTATGATSGSSNNTNFVDSAAQVSFSTIADRSTEGQYNRSFTINISQAKPYPVTVQYSVVSGNATVGTHYNLASGSAVIPANQTSVQVTYDLPENVLADGEKSFSVQLNSTDSAYASVGSQNLFRQFIIDNDQAVRTSTQVSVGRDHRCALQNDQKIRCFGKNSGGPFGTGDQTDRLIAAATSDGLTYSSLSARGLNTTCGITTTGVLRCWGYNGWGQVGDNSYTNRLSSVVIDSGTNYSRVSTGSNVTCGITTGGVLKCWGDGTKGEMGDGVGGSNPIVPTVVDAGTSYSEVAVTINYFTTQNFVCGITTAGAIKCWGGNRSWTWSPTVIDASDTYTKISAGDYHACAINIAGRVKCFGMNTYGELGDGTQTDHDSPALIADTSTYQDVSAGAYYTCGVTTAGTLKCWGGFNDPRGTGVWSDANILTPREVGQNFTSVDANVYTACGIHASGGVFCWGSTDPYYLGNPNGSALSPVAFDANRSFNSYTIGSNFTCGQDASGNRTCWGLNGGNFGDSLTANRFAPYAVPAAFQVQGSRMVGNGNTYCQIKTGGTLYCWGLNSSGQLLTGGTAPVTSPIQVDSTNLYQMVAVGSGHICGITTTGALRCWGDNSMGQVGDNTTTPRTSGSVLIDSGTNYIWITAAGAVSCGVTSTNVLKCWGQNTANYFLGDTTTTNRLVPTVINSGTSYSKVFHSGATGCGITTANALKCWGANMFYTVGDGTNVAKSAPVAVDAANTFSKVAFGTYHVCGVTTAGPLRCWGINTNGRLGDGSSSIRSSAVTVDSGTNYTDISIYGQFSIGITSTGTVKAWGDLTYDGSGVNLALPNNRPAGLE